MLVEEGAVEPVNAQRYAAHRLSVEMLLDRVRNARLEGYAYADAGIVSGTRAVAVPVFDGLGQAIAAISIAAITDRLGSARLGSHVALMRRQADAISRRLDEVTRARRRVP
ncbi:MAG: hypothetical protein JSW68_03630 [Burkholderiales bacterium]|nr:MAG: hypothetical protein JSW68_03630 [Burkholderiales bacterium]